MWIAGSVFYVLQSLQRTFLGAFSFLTRCPEVWAHGRRPNPPLAPEGEGGTAPSPASHSSSPASHSAWRCGTASMSCQRSRWMGKNIKMNSKCTHANHLQSAFDCLFCTDFCCPCDHLSSGNSPSFNLLLWVGVFGRAWEGSKCGEVLTMMCIQWFNSNFFEKSGIPWIFLIAKGNFV